jgi:hypothetical protein
MNVKRAFEKIEEILENDALVQLMEENQGEPALNLDEAKRYYQKSEKAIPDCKITSQ